MTSSLTRPKTVVLFDLDGVVYRGDTPTPGAAACLRDLRATGRRIRFLTNNSSRSRRSYCEKLAAMAVEAHPGEIMTSAYATALYLKEMHRELSSALVIGESGLIEELTAVGIGARPAASADPADSYQLVIVGIDRNFNYQSLLRAQQAIVAGAQFIATNADTTFPTETGNIPGAGSIVAAVAAASAQQPFVVGKPNTFSLDLLIREAGVPREEVVLVGDRLDTDIDVGRRAGVETILTLTGVTTREQLKTAPASQQPTTVISTLETLLPLLDGSV